MGGIICYAAKVDPYVLRFADESEKQTIIDRKGASSTSPEKAGSRVTDKRHSSGTVSNLAVVQSEPTTDSPGKMKGLTALRSAAKMVIAANRFSAVSTPLGKIKISSTFPWLIKDADFEKSKISGENIEYRKVIGYGLMGIVRIAKLKGQNAFFAVKSIRKDYIKRHHDDRHIKNEREILLKLRLSDNPFCIKLLGTFQDTKHVYFAMELAVGGELFRRLSKKESFSPQVAKFYSIEIFSILEHIHALGYVYRDLKPENIMLDENGHCKLVDFGFSVRPDHQGLCHTNCGTPAYLSPEQLNGKFTNGYTKIVDWWALGCLIYELLTGLTPFCKDNRETQYAIYLRVLKGKIYFPRSMESDARDIVGQLCSAELEKRLCDPIKIKDHIYFESVKTNWDSVKKQKLLPPFIPRLDRDSGDDRHFDDYGHYFQNKVDGATDCLEHYEGF